MKVIFKFLLAIVLLSSFSHYSMGAIIMKEGDEFKSCKAECYRHHAACLAVCDKQREQYKKIEKKSHAQSRYNKCRYDLENSKCLPELNTCVTTKCHPFFKA